MREKRFQRPWRFLTLLAGVTAGAVLRVWAACDDFWLDEIMSLGLAQGISHSWEILTLHHDNNHILNTLYLFLIGQQQNWVWYRILSVVTGTAFAVVSWKRLLQPYWQRFPIHSFFTLQKRGGMHPRCCSP